MRYFKNCSLFRSIVTACMLSFIFFSFTSSVSASDQVLVKVDVNSAIESLKLDVYAHLQTQKGEEYAFVIESESKLQAQDTHYEVIHHASQKGNDRVYLLAYERIVGTLDEASHIVEVLHNDGKQLLAVADKAGVDALVMLGLEVRLLPAMPMKFAASSSVTSGVEFNTGYVDAIGDMINKVTQNTVYTYTGNLSGVNTVQIGGGSYKIESRATGNKTWIDRATQYTRDWFSGKGYSVSYHSWNSSFNSGRNVIAEKKGSATPNEIVLVTGHLDDVPSSGRAPGADDNASGSVGVMIAAEIMAGYQFDRTVRFVHFTGEEQGLLGSAAYAKKCKNAGDNIVAVLNMDMIAWDAKGGPVARIHTRTTNSSGYQKDKALADTFINVVKTYGLSSSLDAIIDPDGVSYSDHASFWNQGYAAILAIEDDNDFNANYHTVNDTLSNCNMKYYTAYVKACVGAAASYAGIGIPGKLSLNVTIEGKGSVSLDPPGGSYDKGTRVTLRATPDTNESFIKWLGDLAGTTSTTATLTMDSNKNVTAQFTGTSGPSCKGYCGGKSPDGCWCDSFCESYGDCCPDKVQQCGY